MVRLCIALVGADRLHQTLHPSSALCMQEGSLAHAGDGAVIQKAAGRQDAALLLIVQQEGSAEATNFLEGHQCSLRLATGKGGESGTTATCIEDADAC